MRITVIGTGYLGAVHAVGMAYLGHDVLGVDTDKRKIDSLTNGVPPFYEPDLADVLVEQIQSGRLRFTTSLEEAADFGDVHFLCVGTPQLDGGMGADMRHVDAAISGLAAHLRRPCLVVGKSTVPVGTAARLQELITALAPVGAQAGLAWNPEFLREGFAVQDTLSPDRLVFGTTSDRAVAVLREVYAPIVANGAPVISTDLATAELVKVSANAFLATKISFINAIAQVCDVAGADVTVLADAIGHDDRIGRKFLSAGLGFGGGCLGKDIRAFRARATELGVGESLAFLQEVDSINLRRRQTAVQLAEEMLGGSVIGRQIGVLGAAFKPNSDDIRDSPALSTASILQSMGAEVRVHDPAALENARAAHPTMDYTNEVSKVFESAELIIHMTEWQEYGRLDPAELIDLVSTPQLLDTRNVLDIERWTNTGWTVRSMGRASRSTMQVHA